MAVSCIESWCKAVGINIVLMRTRIINNYNNIIIVLTCVSLPGSVLQDSITVQAGEIDHVGHGSCLRVTSMCYGTGGERIARKIRSSDRVRIHSSSKDECHHCDEDFHIDLSNAS